MTDVTSLLTDGPADALNRDREAWTHFEDAGANDKNTMIAAVTWLLGLGAAPVAYVMTQRVVTLAPRVAFTEPDKVVLVSAVGMMIAGVAGYVSLLYGGYATRNWAKAASIAQKRDWRDLLPEAHPDYAGSRLNKGRKLSLRWLACTWARDCDPTRELAPVFIWFFVFSLGTCLANMAFLGLAARSLLASR